MDEHAFITVPNDIRSNSRQVFPAEIYVHDRYDEALVKALGLTRRSYIDGNYDQALDLQA